MRIPALALAVRTLRVDARSGAHTSSRAALVLLLLCALAWSQRYAGLFGAPGLRFFWWLVNVDFWCVTLLGIASFSGVITEEKEGMTLGLLDLAGFGSLSILLGKSAGLLVGAALLLLVQLPFAMLSVTMGGVSPHQVAAAFALLGCYVVAVYGVALFASTVCKRSSAAATLTGVVLFVWIAAPRLLLELVHTPRLGAGPVGPFERALAHVIVSEPYGALLDTASTRYAAPLLHRPAVTALALGGAMAACAWLAFRRLNGEEWRAGQSRGLLLRRPRWPAPSRPAPGPAALAWKDFRFVAGGPWLVGARLLVYAAVLVAFARYATGPRLGWQPGSGLATWLAPFLYVLAFLEAAALASRFLLEEVKWHTLPALAGLPYSVRSWSWAKARGCASVLVPIALVVAGDFVVMLRGSRGMASYYFAKAAFALGLVVLSAHVAAYASLRLRRGALAVAGIAAIVVYLSSRFLLYFAPWNRGMSTEDFMLVTGLVLLAVSIPVHCAILAKLRELGGQM